MPLPLNQNTKRGCTAASTPVAAYAVPLELNIAASGGRPTLIAAPGMLMFLRNRPLLSGMTDLLLHPRSEGRTTVRPGLTHGSAATYGGGSPSMNCGDFTRAT